MAAKAGTLTTRRTRVRTSPRWWKWTKRLLAVMFLFFLVGATVFGVKFIGELKHASELMTTLPQKIVEISTKPTVLLSSDGKELYTVQAEFREPVKYDEIPKHVRDAIVAAEDKRFYDHSGIDYLAMGRILAVGAKEGRLSQGGSTLTMQLAKKFYSEGERTFQRKLQDIALAITMEREMSKEQILTLYMNTMYFGEKAYGIQAASEVYFGKPLSKLSIAESAMLARCVRRPSDVNPFKDFDRSLQNRNVVLGIMRDENMITADEYDEALAEKPKLRPKPDRITSKLHRAPYFVNHVLAFLEKDLPEIDFKAGGYRIETTVDAGMQTYAEAQVNALIRKNRRLGITTGAFVLMDKDGKILAEVGGTDFNKDQFNVVTQGLRQPGSSFKPFVYAAALSTGAISMGDYIPNSQFDYDLGPGQKPWRPKNSNGRYSGPVSVETAFKWSMNVPAAHVIERATPSVVAALARDAFGFTTRIPAYPAMALGAIEVRPIDMAQALSVFMLHGDRATPYAVTRVIGPDGNIVREYGPQIKRNVFDPGVCSQVDELMRAVVTSGTGTRAGDVPNARGKTGTTSDNKDAWFVGYANGLVGVGWIANKQIQNGKPIYLPMNRSVFGGTYTVQLWAGVMERAVKKFKLEVPDKAPEEREIFEAGERDRSETRSRTIEEPRTAPDPDDGTTGGDGAPRTGGDPAEPPIVEPPVTEPPVTEPPVAEPPRREPPRREPPRQGEEEGTSVEVCAESGMRATIYCPETVTRKFPRGQAPRRRCTIHGG